VKYVQKNTNKIDSCSVIKIVAMYYTQRKIVYTHLQVILFWSNTYKLHMFFDMNNTCINERTGGPNIYMYMKGKICKGSHKGTQ
jgi:hypothetical protein